MLGTAWIPDLPLQPCQSQAGALNGLLAAGCDLLGMILSILGEQQHQGAGQLLGGPAVTLALEGMPVAIADAEAALQLLRQIVAAGGPAANAVNRVRRTGGWLHRRIPWTRGQNLLHPGAMSPPLRRPSPRRPVGRRLLPLPRGPRLLHALGDLHSLAAFRPGSSAGAGSAERRRRQHLALAQRLLDPLPLGLQSPGGAERFWRVLRWGGAGLLLSRLLAG